MKDEKGMVLVLAIFMLALLSMIGLSSMMTSTTEINISANEKFSKIVYYQSESGLTIGCELIERLQGTEVVGDGTYFEGNEDITVIDGAFMREIKNSDANKVWQKDNQVDFIDGDPDEVNDDGDPVGPDVALRGNFRVNLDIDKLGAAHVAGGGAEFGAGDHGVGVATHKVLYNIESLGMLSEGSVVKADHITGFQLIPRK